MKMKMSALDIYSVFYKIIINLISYNESKYFYKFTNRIQFLGLFGCKCFVVGGLFKSCSSVKHNNQQKFFKTLSISCMPVLNLPKFSNNGITINEVLRKIKNLYLHFFFKLCNIHQLPFLFFNWSYIP